MSATGAVLASWQWRPSLLLTLFVTAAVYVRGWRALRGQMPHRFGIVQLGAFLAGTAAVGLAAASPIDAFAGLLAQVHMAQHFLLTMVAPPLLWYGTPAVPLLRGLPQRAAKRALGPFLGWPALQRTIGALVHPAVAWSIFTATLIAWHLPPLYERALQSPEWHVAEHAALLTAGLLFWWPVVQPWPSRPQWPRWTIVPYLLLADVVNTVIAAAFIFSDRVLYPSYAAAPRVFGGTALADQVTAGALMWVPGSIAFLIPVILIIVELLTGRRATVSPAPSIRPWSGLSTHLPLPMHRPRAEHRPSPPRFDLLALPGIGSFLRWRYGRRALQLITLLLAVAVIVDGLLGPPMAPMNLAGVLPWTYWRAAAVAALLVAGNAVCLVCPFMLPRELAKRLFSARRIWPRWARAKWLGAALLVAYLWSYEVLAPWDSPRWTAAIVVTYFAAAFAVDAWFRGAAFCKYVCPIGQFQFVQSLASPLTIGVRNGATCRSCTTTDCLRGNVRQRGCELDLFLPEKRGNLDCTFCLDCVAACPHDNIGILACAPVAELARDPRRASIGRLGERRDIAALIMIAVFAAFSNAAAMVEPVTRWMAVAAEQIRFASAATVIGVAMLLTLIGVPVLTAAAAGWASCRLGGGRTPVIRVVCRFAPALIPLGLCMWSAHFAFHFYTGAAALKPVLQRIATELGNATLGNPTWAASGPLGGGGDITAIEIAVLDLGLVASVYAVWRIAVHDHGRQRGAIAVATPWMAVSIMLWAAGAWIVCQPMAMRGMIH